MTKVIALCLNCVVPLHTIQGQWKPVNTAQHLMMAWLIKQHLISLRLVISARWLFATISAANLNPNMLILQVVDWNICMHTSA